ncbi:PaeR7I family type II restriction endonuclease [Actinokineospora globicatena]|uniref:PaeR7I family type II restriction endonuclease n=1 Tax=Actinokineospora globicatena TaxID=103729 RepID=UPI0020A25B47|nr:PaeR7I family type II restriction endonuclease [Actinokineospora globicatena]MCP2304655.1 Restriction endonuclease XhoI [Actinokineospora globicatena]GLW77971.1 hypothetical protein Aglo01_24530 [Actinokineospora globicatena]GLW85362.1 hypothetical protein Aglo02_30020 [Actinokineospora globicatena]
MTTSYEDYDLAIRAFWAGRDLQAQKQVESGRADAGTRGSVTGGQHLAALQQLIAREFYPLAETGIDVSEVAIRYKGAIPLPGYYRRTKSWDVVVTYKGILVAAIECKSQVGSFGKNFNNRTEEAIGNAVDLRRAYQAGLVGPLEPWIGFVFVIEHAPDSTLIDLNKGGRAIYRADPLFDGSSYVSRYQILLQRLVRERLYDAACLVTSVKGEGIHSEPIAEVSTRNFAEAIAERIAYIKGLA